MSRATVFRRRIQFLSGSKSVDDKQRSGRSFCFFLFAWNCAQRICALENTVNVKFYKNVLNHLFKKIARVRSVERFEFFLAA